jgi:hypothetical protein
MSSFAPTIRTLEPPEPPDQLAGAVMTALGRPVYGSLLPWGPIKSLVLGAISLGVLPLIIWPRIFARYCIAQQQQFWHLLEWLRIRQRDSDAAELQNSLGAIGPTVTLRLAPAICLIIVAMSFFGWPFFSGAWLVRPLEMMRLPMPLWRRFSLYNIHLVWTICLFFAYGSHWLHIREHAANVNQLVRRINAILYRHGITPVGVIEPGTGLRPLWILAAIVGVLAGAWWAIPAAMAGALQRQYMRRTSLQIRSQLSQRVAALMAGPRPPVDVPATPPRRLACGNSLCAGPIPVGAQFCPRCGARAGA